MAKVRLIIPDENRDRFVDQARREGMTLSAWLRAAAHGRLGQGFRRGVFDSPDTLAEFFHQCDLAAGTGTEPDWREHLAEIDQVSLFRINGRLSGWHKCHSIGLLWQQMMTS